MDTRLLRTFRSLARTGNFTTAAAELHLAQSTVTVHVRTLEQDLGARLFDRLPRGAVLTDAGRRLLSEAEAVLDAEARLRAAAAAADGGPVSGEVVIGAGETLCSARLPGVVAALRRTHPDVGIHLQPSGTADAVDGLRSGRLDLALLLEEEAAYPDLDAERIAEEPLVLVAAPGHPLARGRRAGAAVGWAELAREHFFLHEQGCSYSDRLARELLAVPGVRPRLTRFGSIEAARSCVAAGLGLTLMPRVTVAGALRDGTLAEVAGPRFPDVPVQSVRLRRRWRSPAVGAVVAELGRHFGPR
ncbi:MULTISPECIES: LysR family transcriptional regulator [unclassified Streptomyces]|uniref:LysR family transcriptional regulator n=1 Tax=unclassified Streptomyces TaxID=2593676 RepID=UPI0008DE8AAE|nr:MULTISPECIES: LysR family transcriptional regulator [unclassified Streptomyces]OII67040.1 LysR family transcriptional regulator [Streptomyces sp. CC77]